MTGAATHDELPAVGFLGIGIMGEAMARNLLKLKGTSFSRVVVWNRTAAKCDALVAEGAELGASPADVVRSCAVTFAMLADPQAALDAALHPETGAAAGAGPGHDYVDLSTVDAATSQRIAAAITAAGGRFVEAPVSGSKGPAIAGQLVILAAGDAALFKSPAVAAAFGAMGKRALCLGEVVGAGARMKLIVNAVMGSMMGALAEGVALAGAAGLNEADLVEVLGLGAMACPMFALKGPALVERSYPPAFPLKHQQKDLRLALALGDELMQPLPVVAAANELFKAAKARGLGDADFSAVFEAVAPPPSAAGNGGA